MGTKCVVRIFRKDAELLAREFNKLDELLQIVKREEEYLQINLTGSLFIAKVFASKSKKKVTYHTYYLYGPKDETSSILSRTCGKRVRGCFIPIPQL